MEDFFKGLPKSRKTKGTRLFVVRNYIALVLIGFGFASGLAFHFSSGSKKLSIDLEREQEEKLDTGEVNKMKWLLPFSIVPPRTAPPS